MKMNLIEMEGLLHGNGIPGDLKVNESNASYLVRKFSELEAKCATLAAKGMELAAEAAVVYDKYNETQMPDRDLVDMQTIQEMHDLCAGMQNADAFLAEVRAQGVEMFADFWEENCRHNDTFIGGEAKKLAAQLRQDAKTAELVAAGIITKVGE